MSRANGTPQSTLMASADPNRWAILAAFQQANSAHVARIQLRAAGVPCIFSDRNHVEIAWLPAHTGGEIYLRVAPEYASKAKEILTRLATSMEPRPANGALAAPANGPGALVMGYGNPLIVALVSMAHFKDVHEAHMAASILAAAGVPCGISEPVSSSGLSGRVSATPKPATLCVSLEDVDRALAVLNQTPVREQLLGGKSSPEAARAALASDRCPRCGSLHTRKVQRWWQVLLGVVAMAWLPLLPNFVAGIIAYVVLAGLWAFALLISRPQHCRNCGYEWSPRHEGESAEEEAADAEFA